MIRSLTIVRETGRIALAVAQRIEAFGLTTNAGRSLSELALVTVCTPSRLALFLVKRQQLSRRRAPCRL